MDYEDLKNVISIPEHELSAFRDMIKKYRTELVSSPSDTVERVFDKNPQLLSDVINNQNISETITKLREACYSDFLVQESNFNVKILKNIGVQFKTPDDIINIIINEKLDLNAETSEILTQVKGICGEYAGRMSPYIYQLCLSNTQSRRSRAGKTFETIIYKMYELFDFPFSSQKKIGRTEFSEQGLGKIVDSLLPNIESFKQRRDKTIIGTMKTTLRERWQEVIEELQRTNLPSIHLLTMDKDISETKATQMAKHNVIIVVPLDVKNCDKLRDMRNIISFENYFTEEIPTMLKFWGIR